MTIKCGINGEDLNEPQIFLCHHCGMPVCEQHGRRIDADDAFAAPEPELLRRLSGASAPVVTEPQSAMHCRNCVEQFHRIADRRQRRNNPGQQAIRP